MQHWGLAPSTQRSGRSETPSMTSTCAGGFTGGAVAAAAGTLVLFPRAGAWGTVKAGRLPASLWVPWLFTSPVHCWLGGRAPLP